VISITQIELCKLCRKKYLKIHLSFQMNYFQSYYTVLDAYFHKKLKLLCFTIET